MLLPEHFSAREFSEKVTFQLQSYSARWMAVQKYR
jgi:hypothetical protein